MLSKIKYLIIYSIIFLHTAEIYAHAASKASKACVLSDGRILIRSKCKKGEKILSPSTLNSSIATSTVAAGPAGSQGVVGTTGIVGLTGVAGAQGAQGPMGSVGPSGQLDFSGCRLTAENYVSNFLNPANPVLYAEVSCDPNTEFLLQDESRVSFFPDSIGSRAALQGRFTDIQDIGGDKREYSVGIYANRFLTVGQGIFELVVRAVCCPR